MSIGTQESPVRMRTRMRFFGRQWRSFQVCGATGLLLGLSLAVFLALRTGRSPWILLGLLGVAAVVFLALAMATKVLTGRESLVYYHHEVAILAMSAALLSALGLPVLPYIDLLALGLGVFLVCGRQGCLMVGCCHGKPHRWGVHYGEQHAAEGFPRCYVGVRLFPVQALESFVVAMIVLGCALLLLQGRPPGTALSWYVLGYSLARIWLEELRGDLARPYWLRLSEAQWTSLLLITGVVMSEWQGRLPWTGWHLAMLGGAVLSIVFIAFRGSGVRSILLAGHAGEIADLLRSMPAAGGPVAVRRTSQSIGISTQSLGRLRDAQAMLYSLSRVDRRLTPDEARVLADLIVNLGSTRNRPELRPGRHGVFHLILRDTPPPARPTGGLHV